MARLRIWAGVSRSVSFASIVTFVLSVAAIGFAVPIVRSAMPALSEASDTIAYTDRELSGVRYVARVGTLFRQLLDCRSEVERHVDGGACARIAASIAAIRDPAAAGTTIDDAVADQVAGLQRRWSSSVASGRVSALDVSELIASIQVLFQSIFSASGLLDDPTADGQNLGDATLRFPSALADGSAAASLTSVSAAAANRAMPERLAALQLVAQAETALGVGRQDVRDEISINANATEALAVAKTTAREFQALKRRIVRTYAGHVYYALDGQAHRELLADREAYASATFAALSVLRAELVESTTARAAKAQQRYWRALLRAAGGVGLELFIIIALGWASTAIFRNQRQRVAAERRAIESERRGFEVQLAHAKAQQALLSVKAQFRAVFDRAPTGMIVVDPQGVLLDINHAAQTIVRASGGAMTAATLIADHLSAIENVFTGALDLHSEERSYLDSSGRVYWVHVSISAVRDESGVAQISILMIRDISENKSMEAQLLFEAGHDGLTGLPNRKRFLVVLQEALDARERCESATVFSVVFIDFNDFKTINDSFGHQAGDRFLVGAATRLRDSIRSTDAVARIGGDEFAVIMHGTDRWEIEKSVKRLQSVVSVPVDIEGQLVTSSASFGIAQAERNYSLAADIIRDADTAMYQAKAQGGRDYVVFDPSMREKVMRRMQLSIDILHALEHHELELHYQPIVDLRSGKVAGCEALVRWRRADGLLVAPSEFLPLAEENGSIIEIGQWVTATACEQMHSWNERVRQGSLPGVGHDFVIHVNLAVPEVHHVNLATHLRRTLARTNVAREQIMLEITEGIVLENTSQMRSILTALSSDGFRLCIDDFGTGYSSLRYLNELPLHSFKIDRSFVSNGSADLANESIVEMLMVLSRSVGLSVVAEGIETQAQREKLCDLGCWYGQGYLFAPALDAGTFTAILERDTALADSAQPTRSFPFVPA